MTAREIRKAILSLHIGTNSNDPEMIQLIRDLEAIAASAITVLDTTRGDPEAIACCEATLRILNRVADFEELR